MLGIEAAEVSSHRAPWTKGRLIGQKRPLKPKEALAPGRPLTGGGRMESDRHYAEKAPVNQVNVDPFWINRTPVTNRQFREFVGATGHVTFAEIAPDPKDYPGALPHMLRAGSLVFNPPKHPVDLGDWSQWWPFKFGANWILELSLVLRLFLSQLINRDYEVMNTAVLIGDLTAVLDSILVSLDTEEVTTLLDLALSLDGFLHYRLAGH